MDCRFTIDDIELYLSSRKSQIGNWELEVIHVETNRHQGYSGRA
jgi:hypothetical protein